MMVQWVLANVYSIDNSMLCDEDVVHSKLGFLADVGPSVASVTVSGFLRLIRWLISVAFGFSASWTDAPADDEPPAPDDDDDEPPCDDCGMGFIKRAISRLTSSMDCNLKKKKYEKH